MPQEVESESVYTCRHTRPCVPSGAGRGWAGWKTLSLQRFWFKPEGPPGRSRGKHFCLTRGPSGGCGSCIHMWKRRLRTAAQLWLQGERGPRSDCLRVLHRPRPPFLGPGDIPRNPPPGTSCKDATSSFWSDFPISNLTNTPMSQTFIDVFPPTKDGSCLEVTPTPCLGRERGGFLCPITLGGGTTPMFTLGHTQAGIHHLGRGMGVGS